MSVHPLMAACGLYCGACYHYRASFSDPERLARTAAERGLEPQEFLCRGCRSDKLYIFPACAQCEIRACADRHGVDHCGVCAEFPCDAIVAFQNDGRVHHVEVLSSLVDLREKGAEKWLADQEQRWTCGCGEGFSWYDQTCPRCGKPVNSYGKDPVSRS